MIRFILVMAVVFALPFIAWRLRDAFMTTPAGPMPTGTLALIGAGLAVTSMVVLAALSIEASDSEGVYQPPRLEEGEVRPGRFQNDEREPDPDRPSLER